MSKLCLFKDVADISCDTVSWNIDRKRRLTDSEIKEAEDLKSLLEGVTLTDTEDIRIQGDGRVGFSAKSVFKELEGVRRCAGQLGVANFPVERVWKNPLVPPKVAFFVWTLVRGRVLTVDKLKKRGLHIVSRCCLCKCTEEFVQHLFVDCLFTKRVWNFFSLLADNPYPSNSELLGRLSQGGRRDLSRVGKIYWNCIFHAIVWALWNEQNRRIFEVDEKQVWHIIGDIKELVWSWALEECEGKKFRLDQIMCDWDSIVVSTVV